MERPLFSDIILDGEYRTKGYLHIPAFINEQETDALRNTYQKKEKSFFDKGFHRTLDLKNRQKKIEICNEITKIVTPASQRYLFKYRCLLTSFMTKEKGAAEFDIHQNWTFVEEDKFTSLVIWIPLQDVDEKNGTMYFVPGSDKWDKGIRGNNITWQYADRQKQLLEQMKPVYMKAGDAVIFDDATIHYTSANRSSKPRISIAQVMIPEEAKPVFYNKNIENDTVEMYEISDDFYIDFTNKYLRGIKDNIKLSRIIK